MELISASTQRRVTTHLISDRHLSLVPMDSTQLDLVLIICALSVQLDTTALALPPVQFKSPVITTMPSEPVLIRTLCQKVTRSMATVCHQDLALLVCTGVLLMVLATLAPLVTHAQYPTLKLLALQASIKISQVKTGAQPVPLDITVL